MKHTMIVFALLALGSFYSYAQVVTNVPDIPQKEDTVFETVETDAAFPGGTAAWRKYLEKNLNAGISADNGAPVSNYTVLVRFIVDKDGSVYDIRALTNHGYGMEDEVIRVIKKGPAWIPAMQNGKTVKAYRMQPVTFIVIQDGFDIFSENGFLLYTENNNTLTIEAEKLKPEDLAVTISQGTIEYTGKNMYSVKVNSPGKAIITIFNKKKGMKEIGSASFEVRNKGDKGPVYVQPKTNN